jgi:hypothetical protein
VITTKWEKFQDGNGQDTGSSAVLKTYRFQPFEEIVEVPLQTAIYGGLTEAAESLESPNFFSIRQNTTHRMTEKNLTG